MSHDSAVNNALFFFLLPTHLMIHLFLALYLKLSLVCVSLVLN